MRWEGRLLIESYDMVLVLKHVNGGVLFWILRREENREADALVNAASDEEEYVGH